MSIPALPTRPALPFATAFLSFVLAAVLASAAYASVTYTYDAHHRLASATYDDGTSEHYSYDDTGNRLTSASSPAASRVYENAEDGDTLDWDIYDNDPAGSTIANVYDNDRASRVIEFTGSGSNNGYRLRNASGVYWNDATFKTLSWSLRYSESFTVYIAVQTTNGFRYLYYTPENTSRLGNDVYIHHGLGAQARNGHWQTIDRDLVYDLKQAQPENELISVLDFLIRGSGRVDDIATRSGLPTDLDTDGDSLNDVLEIGTYGTNPYDADTDADGMDDKAELEFWGAHWNADPDGDGSINLLDPDADNDGFTDGVERRQATDPAIASSVPNLIMYEDAENGDTAGWDIYDNDPAGAAIANVYDNDRASQVIEFTGSGSNNGYRLRDANGSYWNDANFKTLLWSMKYNEPFTVYIAVQTKNGFRYLYYTPIASNNLGSETYVHHGLGGTTRDGAWHTLTRNLEQDLKDAQPDNELQAVLGFLIRGSGRVDGIKTK